MFGIETNNIVKSSAYNSIQDYVTESISEFYALPQKVDTAIDDAIEKSSGVFDDSVEKSMATETKELLNKVVDNYKEIISIFNNIKSRLYNEYCSIEKNNKYIAQKYEPLLKQLDTNKETYQIPTYTLNKFTISDMLKNLLEVVNKRVNLSLYSDSKYKDILDIYTNNPKVLISELRRGIFKFPSTINVDGDFSELICQQFSNPNTIETKSFSSDIFKQLKQSYYDPSDIDSAINLFQLELKKINEIVNVLNNNYQKEMGTSYYNLITAKVTLIQSVLVLLGAVYIEKAVNCRLQAYQSYSKNLIGAILCTYKKLTGSTVEENF